MPEGNKPFVVTDRRKFTMEGEVRPDAAPREEPKERKEPVAPELTTESGTGAQPKPGAAGAGETARTMGVVTPAAEPQRGADAGGEMGDEAELPAPTTEQMDQSKRAYEQTAERIETAIRATNPGMEHPPTMDFEQLVQSVYLTAIMQLGGATPEGEQPRVDLLGTRSSIDMMGVLTEKTAGNLSDREQKFLDSALFELRMAFLEMTQALARSAQGRAGQGGPQSPLRAPGAPMLVR